jgi:sugar/nucleoside kinase (ribokinase family)
MKRVACVGILVADVIVEPVNEYPGAGELTHVNSITLHNGGNAMTAAINLTKLGVPASMVGKVGNDMFGAYLKGILEKDGIDTRGLSVDEKVQTSASVALIAPSGERSFLHCVGANAVFSINDIDFKVIEECDLVFVTGTYLLKSFDGDETVAFLKKCKEMGRTTFLDVCFDATGRWGELLFDAMPYIDYFMPSIDEAVKIAGKEEPDDIADVFFSKGVKNVVIKMGSKGSYLRLAGEEQGKFYPALKGIKAVDTTGAGDSFCSGFLSAMARDESPEFAIGVANTTGALSVTAKGATTGIRPYDETLKFKAEHE